MAIRRRIPAAIRFNNSGAQYPGPISRRFGSPGHSVIGGGHLIARFDTPDTGAAAHFALLGSRYSGLTLEGAIKKWSGGNSNSAYTRFVSRSSGLQPSDRITTDVLASPRGLAMVRAMAQWEAGGQRYPLDEAGWRQAQEAGLGSSAAYENLRQAQVAGRQRVATATAGRAPDTSDPSLMAGANETPNVGGESEATRRMLASGQRAPQLAVVDPMNPTAPISPVESPGERPAPRPQLLARPGSGASPAWASDAFGRGPGAAVDPVQAISPVPEAPPSSRLLLGDSGLSPMWNRQQPIMRGLLSAMFGSGGVF
jgi:hypothetical protein